MKIILNNIVKSYKDKQVIQNTSLTIEHGTFTTLLGPSGCGKTTLLRILAGLESPDSGEVFFDDQCIFSSDKNINIPPEKRGLGFVFQDFALWPHMTVFENVAFGLRAGKKSGKYPQDNIAEEVTSALRAVQLEGYEKRYPHQLSGGQQQRVAFARAIVIKPRCILFDEPLSALDALLREEMRSELTDLTHRLGITSVFVTHDQTEAMSMSHQIAVLSAGVVEQYDCPTMVYDHPKTEFVARFVGASNWLNDKTMFRPEKALVLTENQAPTGKQGQVYQGNVLGVQFLGGSYLISLQREGEKWVLPHHCALPVGETLSIFVEDDNLVHMTA